MKNNISGVGVALVTPFDRQGKVDLNALEILVDRTIQGGVDYLVVLGTTAETATLTEAEKQTVITCISQVNARRVPMVIGIGGNNTAAVEAQIRAFDFTPFDAVLSVTPYYNKPSQEGMYQHYLRIAEASPVPVILYNVPGRTGVNLQPQTVLRLAEATDRIIAVKEASGQLSQAAYILRDRPEGFRVISGDDNLTLPMVALGGDGVISVAANAFPRMFCRMVHAAQQGNMAEAAALHLRMMETVDALFAEGNPTGVKAALAHYGVMENHLRLPLVAASDTLSRRIAELIDRNELE